MTLCCRYQWQLLFLRLQNYLIKGFFCVIFGCLIVSLLLHNRFLKVIVSESKEAPRKQSPLRVKIFHLWAVKDDNFFTDKEYEELLTSSLRRQHFDPPEWSADVWNKDKYWSDIFEGKDDYFTEDENNLDINIPPTCEIPVKNILFLKTHYTGSDIITNIIDRYADFRELRVALPDDGLSSFYWPSTFHWRYMDIRRLKGNLPNVLCNHARYNADVMEKFMPFNTHYVTMIRKPMDYFVTLFEELDIPKRMESNFTNFVLNIKIHLQNTIKQKKFFNTMNLLKNGMFFDLGLPASEYNNKIAIDSAMFDLQKKFSLVLIYEYLDESLVLMKRKFCWDIDDVIYLSLNLPRKSSSRIVVSSRVREVLSKWNMADEMLYETFNASLWEKIRHEKDFDSELIAFRARRKTVGRLCRRRPKYIPQNVDPLNMKFNSTFTTTVKLEQFCEKMAMTTNEYLDYFRNKI